MPTTLCVGLLTGALAVCLVQFLQVLLSDCYGRTLQLRHILANFYKLSGVFCKYNFFQFQYRTKNLPIVNILEIIAHPTIHLSNDVILLLVDSARNQGVIFESNFF